MNVVLLAIVFLGLDRGRLVSPASARAQDAQVRRLRAVARARLTARGLDASALRGAVGEPALASDTSGD
jgi:hypothetical protein